MKRFHNYRISQKVRDENAEVHLYPEDFIAPFFVVEGKNIKNEISTLKGVYHLSVDRLLEESSRLLKYGVDKILLFGVMDNSRKDKHATTAWEENNLIAKAVKNVKSKFPDLVVFTDVCLCGYTDHGHCGIVDKERIDNDATLPVLSKMAVSHARAGADFVCPSAMMDGQVKTIRNALKREGLTQTKILSYSVKYASSFYGPFRDAAQSAPSFGDRKTYQMDYRTIDQGIQETLADMEEGADWLMVKPAQTYLDMITRIKEKFPAKKLAAYHVSGEYMLIKAAARLGYVNEKEAMLEILTAIKRAGADILISYYAEDFAKYYQEKNVETASLLAEHSN